MPNFEYLPNSRKMSARQKLYVIICIGVRRKLGRGQPMQRSPLTRWIKTLVNQTMNSGYKSIQWNGTNNQGQPVSAGVYLYSIEAGDFRQTKKMILLK